MHRFGFNLQSFVFLRGTFHSNTSLSDLVLHMSAFIIVSVLSMGCASSGAYLLPSHVIYVAADHRKYVASAALYDSFYVE